MKNDQSSQPIGYDSQGQPLYHASKGAPAASRSQSLVSTKPVAHEGHNFDPRLRAQYSNEPDYFHASRPIEPEVSGISEELRQKHEKSKQEYPFLNLSEGEYVVLRIKRHPIGMLIPILASSFAVILLASAAFLVPDIFAAIQPAGSGSDNTPSMAIAAILLLLAVISALIGTASVWVYQKNQFFLTNESVVQEIQHGLFSHHEQTVSLGSIEDASFRRSGILQHLFNFGTMRLSTEGEETTYQFAFVENPKRQVAIVSNAVEAFKNGRPVAD